MNFQFRDCLAFFFSNEIVKFAKHWRTVAFSRILKTSYNFLSKQRQIWTVAFSRVFRQKDWNYEYFEQYIRIPNLSFATKWRNSFPNVSRILGIYWRWSSRPKVIMLPMSWKPKQFWKEEKSGKFYRCHIETIRDEIRQHLQFRKERPRVLCMQLRFTVKTSRVVG